MSVCAECGRKDGAKGPAIGPPLGCSTCGNPLPEVRNAILGLVGSMTAAADQVDAMTDAELGELLLTGRYTTIEVHEAGRRLALRAGAAGNTEQ